MHAIAAARMRVQSRSRNPLPLEETERRLEGAKDEDRAFLLHNAGYTERSFKDAVSRRDWLNSDLFRDYNESLSKRPAKKRLHRKRLGRRAPVAGWLGT